MARGNCLIAVYWWLKSGRQGDLVIRGNTKDKRGVHFTWAERGVCPGTYIRHRQPVYRQSGWRAWMHWWFTYEDRHESVRECDARAERRKHPRGQ